MKIKIQLLFLLGLLIFSARAGVAQTSTLKINYGSPNAGPSVCKVRTSNNKYEVIVARSLEPEVEDLQNAGVKIVGNEVIYSFKPDNGVEAICQNVNNGLEIVLSGVVTDSGTQNSGSGIPSQPAIAALPLTDTAKEVPKKEAEKEAKKDILDLSVPESPGFTILGLNPQTVVRPASPREFVATLINGLDNNGNFQTGVAIDTAPYLLLANTLRNEEAFNPDGTRKIPILSLADYRKNPKGFNITRVVSRIQFSLATTKGTTTDDKSARIGTGLHFTIFDYGDPRMDTKFDDCFAKFNKDIEQQARIDLTLNPDLSVLLDRNDANKVEDRITQIKTSSWLEQFKKTCVIESKKRNFARSSFIIGGAGSWISKSGESSKFTYNGAGFWSSLAYGFEGLPGLEQKAQLIFHFRRRVKEEVPDPLNTGKFIAKDSNLFGARLRFGTPKLTGNIEGVYQGEHFAGRKADDNFRLSLGADYKVADNVYLNFSIGGETKKSNISDNKVFVRTSFNFGTSQKALNK